MLLPFCCPPGALRRRQQPGSLQRSWRAALEKAPRSAVGWAHAQRQYPDYLQGGRLPPCSLAPGHPGSRWRWWRRGSGAAARARGPGDQGSGAFQFAKANKVPKRKPFGIFFPLAKQDPQTGSKTKPQTSTVHRLSVRLPPPLRFIIRFVPISRLNLLDAWEMNKVLRHARTVGLAGPPMGRKRFSAADVILQHIWGPKTPCLQPQLPLFGSPLHRLLMMWLKMGLQFTRPPGHQH